MRHAFTLLLALAAAPLMAQAAGPAKIAPGAPDLTRVVAGTYKVEPSHTQVNWAVNHMGFTQFSGAFADSTGTLVIDPKRPEAATLSITIPIDRVVTTSAALNKHLKGADFFDAAKYPTATFVSTQVEAMGQRAKISGNLTLHGVTKPVVLDARFVGAGMAAMGPKVLNMGFEATTRISRSDFGIKYAVPLVGDTVDLSINAAFVKE